MKAEDYFEEYILQYPNVKYKNVADLDPFISKQLAKILVNEIQLVTDSGCRKNIEIAEAIIATEAIANKFINLFYAHYSVSPKCHSLYKLIVLDFSEELFMSVYGYAGWIDIRNSNKVQLN